MPVFDHAQAPVSKYRTTNRKTRTGCRTCKIRRVKCDEAKPSCRRCSSTGRKCDGYEDPRPPAWSVMTGPSVPAAITRGNAVLLDQNSSQFFDYFRSVTVFEFSRFFSRAFWSQSLLCVSNEFPAVCHAIVAVSSLHRRYKESRLGHENQIDLFACQQYHKALKQLARDISSSDKIRGRLVSLLCSILFIIIEVLNDNKMGALANLEAAINILNTDPTMSSHGQQTIVSDVEEEMALLVARLDIEASIYSTIRPTRLQANQHITTLSQASPEYKPLLDISLASEELYKLMSALNHFIRAEADGIRYGDDRAVPLGALAYQQALATRFAAWWTRSQHLLSAAAPPDTELAVLLQVHWHTSWTMVQCCLHAECRLYDRHLASFREIVRLASMLNASEKCMLGRTLSLEVGIVYPLYWTALKCRDGELRRAALALLQRCHQEGVWVPEIYTTVAARLIEVEEQFFSDSGEGLPLCDDILEFHRVHCVAMDFDERVNGQVSMKYERLLNGLDGEWTIDREWLRL